MVVLVLTLLVCLAASAAIALFVAYPGRGRPLPEALPTTRSRVRAESQEVRS